jgi:nucleotide-binding universal stress UspA family protein
MYSTILLALDGSKDSLAGGRLALLLARRLGCELVCTHVYDARIHSSRFAEMEPGLPGRYQDPECLQGLRDSHDTLITDGFQALSRGYMEAYLTEARAAGVAVSEAVAEGRNYVEILRLAEGRGGNLIILGAQGLGARDDGLLGSTATRVLRRARCDVLVARDGARPGPVLVGVDGSEHATAALRRAGAWAGALAQRLHLAAAYDPILHQSVFRTMAQALSADQQREVGLERQEELHEELIDEGLGSLYQGFLDQAAELAAVLGHQPGAGLFSGKAYRCLVDHGAAIGAGLLVLGRFGHNREAISDLGCNAEAVARLSAASVLITAPARQEAAQTAVTAVEWDPEALARLDRVPSFARTMARRAVEDRVRSAGQERVTGEIFDEVAARFGMGSTPKGGGG